MFSGSITAHTIPSGTQTGRVLHIRTAALPTYQAGPWQYLLKTNPFTTTVTAQQPVNDLTIRFLTNTRYIVIGYFGCASASTAQGFRVGINVTSATTNIYSIEAPSSTTGIPVIGNNQTASPGTAPAGSATNYYFTKLTALIITAPTGTPTLIPTISIETAGTVAALGPSILYYRPY